jgi:protein SCO1/2
VRRAPLALAALAALAAVGAAQPAAASGRDGLGRAHPNPRVATHDGRTVRLYDDLLRDGVVVLSFGYARCTGSCPPTNGRLREVARLLGDRMGRDVRFVTVTLDPERDTPAALRAHAAALGAPRGWTFVTGAAADLAAIRRFYGLRDERDAGGGIVRHELLLVGNARRGRWTKQPATLPAGEIAAAVLRAAGERAGRTTLFSACEPRAPAPAPAATAGGGT